MIKMENLFFEMILKRFYEKWVRSFPNENATKKSISYSLMIVL